MGGAELESMNLGALLLQGGWAMAPILLCSLVALAVFLRKLIQFRVEGLGDVSWLAGAIDHVRQGDLAGARTHCADVRHPAARVVGAVAGTLLVRPERAEPEAIRVGKRELSRLEDLLGLLAFIAQVAPLLGLLGTVIGMVDLFAGLGAVGGTQVDASRLSSGIWKALLTTAAGLMVAVPALAAHTWLTSRIDRVRAVMGDALQQVLTAAPPPRSEGSLALVPPRSADGF